MYMGMIYEAVMWGLFFKWVCGDDYEVVMWE